EYNANFCFQLASLLLLPLSRRCCNSFRLQKCSIRCRHSASADYQNGSRQRLVILGTGWGSYSALRNVDKSKFDVIVVSPRNHFLFTPLLCSTTVGTLEFRSIIEPVREYGFRQSDHFHLAEATEVDFNLREVTCRSCLGSRASYQIGYDRLIIGVGALTNTFGVPGVNEHAFFLKEVSDARQIRERLIENTELAQQAWISPDERARLLHTVIVGGGPTGVEFGAELYDFARTDLARLYRHKAADVRVTLVESAQILASFDASLRNYAEKKIRARKNFDLRQGTVASVDAQGAALRDGSRLPAGLVVWSTGLAPRPFIRDLDAPKSPSGQLLTDPQLRVLADKSGRSFAIGDCASIVDGPLPCTAQVAERQGRYLANRLNQDRTGPLSESSSGAQLQDEPFRFAGRGMLAYIGEFKALTDTPGVKLHGFTSWLLWRSAYLTRLGSWRLRLQVPVDWTKALLFGRDTSMF
uniref:Pyr_redox_2 domain-containing protein n=1 Tax=Macrostomum lignano TaxID=282301 RepID=A0A1I8HLR4_9PLAT